MSDRIGAWILHRRPLACFLVLTHWFSSHSSFSVELVSWIFFSTGEVAVLVDINRCWLGKVCIVLLGLLPLQACKRIVKFSGVLRIGCHNHRHLEIGHCSDGNDTNQGTSCLFVTPLPPVPCFISIFHNWRVFL